MPGRKRLRRIQWARETSLGTPVGIATARWRGGGVIDDTRVVEEVEEDVGILGGTDRTNITMLGGGIKLDTIPASFEQLQYLFVMGLAGPHTGTADGVGTDLIYQTDVPTTAGITCKPFTVQGGDDFEVEQLDYAHVTKIELSGAAGESLKVTADLAGREVQRLSGGFTAGVALPTIEDILVSKGKVYLDPVSGAYGATQVSNAILGFKLSIEPKWVQKPTMDGSLGFSYLVFADYVITGELTFEHDSAASGSGGEKANWRSQTPRALQLKFEGGTVATPGTAYQKKTFIANLPIKWTKFAALSDKDGNDTVVGTFRSRYNPTLGNAGQFIVVHELVSLP